LTKLENEKKKEKVKKMGRRVKERKWRKNTKN